MAKLAQVVTLPLFPLRTVLFPGGLLPLRIFEPRYVDMVGRCMREGGSFGVILIGAGAEVGAVASLATVGCSARIIDFEKLPDGLLGLLCRGEQRFRLLRHSTQADGLHVGEVEWYPIVPATLVAAAHQPLVTILRRVIPKLGKLTAHLTPDYDNADWVSNRFAEFLPLDTAVRQRLLEMDDPSERLLAITPMIKTD
jgi:Lon protease-like protein